MKLDPGERPTAAQALGHPFLKEVLKGRELLHARDHYDSESISDKTSTTESTAGVVEKSVAAEPDLSVMLSCRNIETENQKRSVDSEFKAPGDNLKKMLVLLLIFFSIKFLRNQRMLKTNPYHLKIEPQIVIAMLKNLH